MSIVSSTAIVTHTEPDGRRYVDEFHVDHLGVTHKIQCQAAAGLDINALAAARAVTLAAQLADEEAANLIGQD